MRWLTWLRRAWWWLVGDGFDCCLTCNTKEGCRAARVCVQDDKATPPDQAPSK